jgi:hypothetical protein
MHDMARVRAFVAVALLPGALASCGFAPARGLAQRCAGLMQEAYPEADIDITKQVATAKSLTRMVAQVEGNRTNLPPNATIARHLAVECTFDNDVLTGFRWTAGPR